MITADDILQDLESFTYRQVLASHPERIALACAMALFECLFLNFRKQYLYVPTTDKESLQRRYEAIWREFDGRNQQELSVRYRLSVQQIYAITNKMRSVSVRQRQSDLFPLPDVADARPLTLVVLEDYLPADLERAGLPRHDAELVALEVARHLCATYPGISVRITEALWRQRRARGGNADLFTEPG